jgi:DNA sulfur modification protein DndE
MSDRILTSNSDESKIIEIQSLLGLSTKAAVIRICVALSLKNDLNPVNGREDLIRDNSGANYHKFTIMGDDFEIYKAIFSSHIGKSLDDDEFFPILFKAHLIRGLEILYSFSRLNPEPEKIYSYLSKKI